MKANNLIKDKSFLFALRIVKLHQYLTVQKKEYIISKQILKSGTSIGANIEESVGGQSRKDFYSKMYIAYKEARETHYWLRLLSGSDIIKATMAESLIKDCEEILRISGTILKTMKKSNS